MAEKASDKLAHKATTEIHRLAFGVRYEPQMKVLDKLGAITDEILRADDSPFGPDAFPLSEAMPAQFRLLNPATNSDLLINAQDTILQLPLLTDDSSTVTDLAEDFDDYILRPLRQVGELKNILRYGIVIHFKETETGVLENSPASRYLTDFPKANSLIMQFSRRLPVEEALAMKRVDDYRNVIYGLNQLESGEVRFSIDYQRYFQPPLDAREWAGRPFAGFAGPGITYIEGEFQKWFETFLAPEVV